MVSLGGQDVEPSFLTALRVAVMSPLAAVTAASTGLQSLST